MLLSQAISVPSAPYPTLRPTAEGRQGKRGKERNVEGEREGERDEEGRGELYCGRERERERGKDKGG